MRITSFTSYPAWGPTSHRLLGGIAFNTTVVLGIPDPVRNPVVWQPRLAAAPSVSLVAAGVSTASMQIAVADPVTLSAAGVATASMPLQATHSVTCRAAASSTASMPLSWSGATATCRAAGVSTASMPLKVAVPLALSEDTAAYVVLDFVVGVPLAVRGAGVSTASMPLLSTHSVTCRAAGVSTASMPLVAGHWGLLADATSTASMQPRVTPACRANGTSTAAMPLKVAVPITCSSNGVAGASMPLTVPVFVGSTVGVCGATSLSGDVTGATEIANCGSPMSVLTLSASAHVLWSTQTPGAVGVEFTITSANPALDPALATAGRFLFSLDEGLTYTPWDATLTPVTTGTVKARHVFVAGDLTHVMVKMGMVELTAVLTIGGKDYPCDARILRVFE